MARTKAVLGTGDRLSDYLSASLLARVYPAGHIRQILDDHGCNSQRIRSFPAVAGAYYCMALSLYPEAAYEEVFSVIARGLAWAASSPTPAPVAKSSISELRGKNEETLLTLRTITNIRDDSSSASPQASRAQTFALSEGGQMSQIENHWDSVV